jgi:hypothetical protein
LPIYLSVRLSCQGYNGIIVPIDEVPILPGISLTIYLSVRLSFKGYNGIIVPIDEVLIPPGISLPAIDSPYITSSIGENPETNRRCT